MTAYVYLLRADEDGLIKIGFSARLSSRLAAHSGNSSNPVRFELRKLYQFQTAQDARQIEQRTIRHLGNQGFSYRGKKELFKCDLGRAIDAIDLSCTETRICPLRNFPIGQSEMLQAFCDFPSLPEYALESFSADQRELYWKGAQDALICLSYLDGVKIRRQDFLKLWDDIRQRAQQAINSELWVPIINHYRVPEFLYPDEQEKIAARNAAVEARDKIRTDTRLAYVDWQELDEDEAR
jgi:predicted GIY-YIG superfamily endonuclease